jgi:Na+/proline symporter
MSTMLLKMNKVVLAFVLVLSVTSGLTLRSNMDLIYKLGVLGLVAFLFCVAITFESWLTETEKELVK